MKKFATDGCSVMSQLFWIVTLGRKELPWRQACVLHDVDYWVGGTKHNKLMSDKALRRRVKERGYPIIATLMYYAVRMGGVPWLPMPWRWGYGHSFPYKYRERTEDENSARIVEIAKVYMQ